MKTKLALTAALFAVSNLVLAQGGLSIDNVEQHMNAENWVTTQTSRAKVAVQGPIDKFDVKTSRNTIVDTNVLKQSFDGQA